MEPLASRLRPTSLDQFVGQSHLVGPHKPLSRIIEQGTVFSMIFWGPPGVGKTTLARMIAEATDREFYELSAVSAGKDDIRQVVKTSAANNIQSSPVLFIDEIHRFNKAQQDYLLPYVENGQLILIGATTENPSFEVIPALLSRCQIFVLRALSAADLRHLITKASQVLKSTIDEATTEWLVSFANGDARKMLNLLDTTFEVYGQITLKTLELGVEELFLRYDKKGEEHYDTISAFIKSMRASNTDAALYYLARMVHAGEDPKFIARRMVIFASEDIGLAQPTALVVANAVFEAVTKIGYPEAQINLAHGTAYLCQAKKDRSAYEAYFAALDDVVKQGNLPIPLELRNAPTKLMKQLNYGQGYQMYSKSDLLPDKLKGKKYLK